VVVESTLIVGGRKHDNFVFEPFSTFRATLARDMYEALAILIAGYGFNRVLKKSGSV
jgi:hypothetical protein